MIQTRRTRVIQTAIMILLVPVSSAYIEGLSLALPHNGATLQRGFEDNSFTTGYSDFYAGFNLTSGWQIDWTLGENSSAGLSCSKSLCVVTAEFSGQLQGLEISRSLGGLSTVDFPFFLMNSTESTSNPDLSYSVAVSSSDGSWHTAPFFHASSTAHTTYIDLRTLYQGPAARLSLRLTDDIYPKYDGGVQSMTVYSIQFAASQAFWKSASFGAYNASIVSLNGVLSVYGTTSANIPSRTFSIVSAQRSSGLDVDLSKYNVMSVELRTPTPGLIARIVIWNDSMNAFTVFSDAISDTNYHQVLIDLSQNHLGPTIYEMELSWMSSASAASLQMEFRNLVFYRITP